jgi:hypothetical protein
MAERVVLNDGSAIDMLDPASIRAYVRQQLALNIDPTASQLRRLEMLSDHAAELEAKKPSAEGKLVLIDAQKAAAEIERRLKAGEK